MKKFTAFILILLTVLTISSCEAMTVEESTDTMLSAIIENDLETLKKHVDSITLYEPDLPEVVKEAVYANCTYEIRNVTEVDSKNKTVEVAFTNLDVNTILNIAGADIARLTFDEKNIDSDAHTSDAVKIYTTTLQENQDKTVTTTVTLSFTKISGNWVCNLGEDQSKVLLGAMYGRYEF